MGLYTMGRNTKMPNTTKGLIKPKQKHYKKIIKEFLFYDVKLIWDLFEGLGHDSINCSKIPVTIPNHASIIVSGLEKIRPQILNYLQPNTQT